MVLEVGAELTDAEAGLTIGYARERGYCGVVVKGSQGNRWARATALDVVQECHDSGLHVAWLHYAEPGATSYEQEAVHLLETVGSSPLGLGIWVEVEDLGGLSTVELTDWLRGLLGIIGDPMRPPAVMADPDLVLQLAGVSPPPRWVLTEPQDVQVVSPWATRWETRLDVTDDVVVDLYELTSTRGLVPVGPVAERTQPAPELTVVEPEPEPEREAEWVDEPEGDDDAQAAEGYPQPAEAS
jgi:hypothetical protein